jgi:hypothetical protein
MEITKTTVNASDGHFEEHPESYRPRVFAAIMPPMQYRRGGEDGLTPTGREESKVYEILSNGQAIPWPCLPAKELCGFDFWVLYVESLGDVTMMRHALGYNGCAGGAAAIPRIKPIMGPGGKIQIGEVVEYNPALQADGDSAPAAQRKPTMGDLYKQLERTKPRSEESDHISEKIIEAVFDVGCTCLKGGPGCDTWEEYPGQPWGEFAKNSECPIHGEDR